jgi:hypothetical protein
MTSEELRLECLKLALQNANASGILVETSQLIARARAYADFVMNQQRNGGADSVNGAPFMAIPLGGDGKTNSPRPGT